MRDRLSKDGVERIVSAVRDALVREFHPERVILFGSLARGDHNRASDLDVIVVADTELPFVDRIGRALAACGEATREIPVEALVYTPSEWERMVRGGSSFAKLVLEEGRVLHDARSESSRGAAVARAGTPRP